MGAKVSSGEKALSDTDLAYFTQNTGLQREQVVWNIFHPPIQNFHTGFKLLCEVHKGRGPPQVSNRPDWVFGDNAGVKWLRQPRQQLVLLYFSQICYPRTFHQDLAKDIFRLYDRDGNGSIVFEVKMSSFSTICVKCHFRSFWWWSMWWAMDQKNKSWNRYLGKTYRVGFLFWCFLGAQKFFNFFLWGYLIVMEVGGSVERR